MAYWEECVLSRSIRLSCTHCPVGLCWDLLPIAALVSSDNFDLLSQCLSKCAQGDEWQMKCMLGRPYGFIGWKGLQHIIHAGLCRETSVDGLQDAPG
jgi:hypothetical protein